MNNLAKIFFFGLSGKIRLIAGICFLITLMGLVYFIFSHIETGLIQENRAGLESITNLTYQMTDLYLKSSLNNYLGGIAETTRDLAVYYQAGVERGEWDQAEARALFVEFLSRFSPETGSAIEYVALLDLNGVPLLHPDPELVGKNLSHLEVVRKALQIREGFLQYLWEEKIPGTGKVVLKQKAVVLRYFSPWQMIICATIDKSESSRFILLPELKDRLTQLMIGEEGYSFIMDKDGELIIHGNPGLEGKNIRGNTDSLNKRYIDDILLDIAGEDSIPVPAPDSENTGSETADPGQHGRLLEDAGNTPPVIKTDRKSVV